MLRLDRIKLFLLGFALIVVCYFVRQITFIMTAERTEGIVVYVANKADEDNNSTQLSYAVVRFNVEGHSYLFRAESNIELKENEEVEVIYQKKDPNDARIFSFTGFWLTKIIWFIIPLFLWSAFSLSYLDKGELLSLHVWGAREKRDPNSSAQLPQDWTGNKRIEE